MDGIAEIEVFVRVVEARSFTRAGKRLGLTASGVSRGITRLEQRLGVRLLDRSTRSIGLTTDGAEYYARCASILRELEDANTALAQVGGAPRGRLRVDAPVSLGRFAIAPALPRFLAAYPGLAVDLSVRDQLVDPIAEGIDVVVRMAALRETGLVHTKLGTMRMVLVASPRYLERRGRPRDPSDLQGHDSIGFLAGGSALPWRFRSGGEDLARPFAGRLHTNSADAIICAAEAGLGLAQVLEWSARESMARGGLEPVLREHEPTPSTIYALYAREKASLPKVRALLDFLKEALSTAGARG